MGVTAQDPPFTMLKVSLALVDVIVVAIASQWLISLYSRRNRAPLPPGPKGYPLIGNVLDLMVSELWKKGQELGAEYGELFSFLHMPPLLTYLTGDLVYMQSFGQRILLTNSYDTAIDLLETRALNYSDRPNSVMVNEL